jgi:hypothetical protein
MKMYEHIASCYHKASKFNIAMTYLKKALYFAYELHDTVAELVFYERLAICYMYIGDYHKMELYHKRASLCLIEPLDGDTRISSRVLAKNPRTLVEKSKLKGNEQAKRKGLYVKDYDRIKLDFCYLPKPEGKAEVKTQKQINDSTKRAMDKFRLK